MKKLISKVIVFMMVASLVPVLPATVSTYASTMIPIDEAHFPDGLFRDVLKYYDNNEDGYLDDEELSVEELSVSTEPVKDLTGLEYFTNLKELDIYQTSVKSLPELPLGLKKLNCESNRLTSLPKLPFGLEYLNISWNQLTSLPELPNSLKVFKCVNNPLVDLPELPSNLESFTYAYVDITELPKLPTSLEHLSMGNTKIAGILDLSQFHNLKSLTFSRNYITGVKLSPTAKYENINLRGNMMTSTADITGRTDIVWDKEEDNGFIYFQFADQKNTCEHEWSYYYVDYKEATCTEEGAEIYRCLACGTEKAESIPKEDHSFTSYSLIDKAGFGKEGKLQATCTVCQHPVTKNIAAVVAPAISAQTFNNKNKTPKVTVVDAEGNSVAAKATFANKTRKAVGKYKVTVKLTGDNYSGSKAIYFKIVPAAKSISKLTAGKKAFTAKWKKPSSTYRKQMTGYQIRYSTSSKMTNAKTITVKSTTATSKKISKLKAKKTYYVQLRTYKKIGSSYYYSAWSKTKKVKTK